MKWEKKSKFQKWKGYDGQDVHSETNDGKETGVTNTHY